ncbi:MAG: hypothetical protein U9Q92_01050 [archaeon]|nr:hypothetical protein [archaeon]
MSPIEIMLGNMNRLDFFELLLPWILFLAIIFAILKKSEVFGEEISVNATIAAVVSFFIINYTPVGMTLGTFFTTLFGIAAVIITGLLVGILFLGMAGIKPDELLGKANKTAIAVLLGFLALIAFISVGGMSFFNIDSDLVITLFMLLIMLFAIMFIAKGDGDK